MFVECKSVVNRLLTDLVPFNPPLFQQEAANAVSLLVTREHQTVVEGSGSKMSPAFLEWDATTSFLECWVLGLGQDETQVCLVLNLIK